jgi:prepilin-type N-terminal cleavage/methylation domain-containing protein
MSIQRGFTLIELLVTIAVLAILATLAVPSFNNMISKQRLNDNTSSLVTTLGLARSQAVSTRSSVAVCLGTAGVTPTTCSTSNNNIPLSNIIIVPMSNGVTSTASSSVVFSAAGLDQAGPTTFSLCAVGTQNNISVLTMGSVMALPGGTC